MHRCGDGRRETLGKPQRRSVAANPTFLASALPPSSVPTYCDGGEPETSCPHAYAYRRGCWNSAFWVVPAGCAASCQGVPMRACTLNMDAKHSLWRSQSLQLATPLNRPMSSYMSSIRRMPVLPPVGASALPLPRPRDGSVQASRGISPLTRGSPTNFSSLRYPSSHHSVALHTRAPNSHMPPVSPCPPPTPPPSTGQPYGDSDRTSLGT